MALTLRQPWATLIAIGAKRIETRRWHPRENPGVIVIASSKTPMSGPTRDRCNAPPFSEVLPYDAERAAVKAPVGCILAVAAVDEFRPTVGVSDEDLDHEGHFGDYREGRWAWYLTDVAPLDEPIPIPSAKPGEKKDFRLGLWKVPAKLVTPELRDLVESVKARAA